MTKKKARRIIKRAEREKIAMYKVGVLREYDTSSGGSVFAWRIGIPSMWGDATV